jgi:dTDP-4-amino-4,6-dideoxygalactose transaminase
MRKLGFTQSLPYTEELFERLLLLPMNTSVSKEDVEYMSEVIVKFYQN